MRYTLIFLVLFVLLVLQGGVVAHLGLGFVGNLVLLYLVLTVMLGTYEEAFFTVLVGGLMLDLLSSFRMGTNIVGFFAVFGFTHLFITKFVPREPNRLILLVCIAANTILFSLVFVVVTRLLSFIHLSIPADPGFILGRKLLLDLLANIVLAYPVLYVFNFVQNLKLKLQKFS